MELPHIAGKTTREIPLQELAMIIESRLMEILHMAYEE